MAWLLGWLSTVVLEAGPPQAETASYIHIQHLRECCYLLQTNNPQATAHCTGMWEVVYQWTTCQTCLCIMQRLQVEAALRTALQLRRYDDILDPNLVYAFMALVGFYSSFYGTCSKVTISSFLSVLARAGCSQSLPQQLRAGSVHKRGTLFHQRVQGFTLVACCAMLCGCCSHRPL